MFKIIFTILIFAIFNLYAEPSIEELSTKIAQLELTIHAMDESISTLKIKQIILILGLLIALASLYLNWKKEKLNVSITPISLYNNDGLIVENKNSFDKERTEDYFGIKIINFSNFPINISAIGFTLKNSQKNLIVKHGFYEILEFPIEIESKKSKIFKIKLTSIRDKNIKQAYIELQTGEKIKGKSKALNQLIKTL